MASANQQTVASIAQLLERAKPILEEQRKQEIQGGLRFNLMDAFALARSERPHTRFLAYLLNPTERHDQGDVFLERFLKTCCSESFHDVRLDNASVTAEYPIGSGILDILIQLHDQRRIVIENKIDAGEGEGQLRRYRDWLSHQSCSLSGKHLLLYLTRQGEPSTIESSNEVEVASCSYAQIVDWLSSIKELPLRVASVVEQYAEVCRNLCDVSRSVTMSDDLRELLRENENLEAAFKVSEALPQVQEEVQQEFWERVRSLLEGKISGINHWHVVEDGSYQETYWKSVVISQQKGGSISKNQFSVMCERQVTVGSRFGYGVNRGCEKKPGEQDESELELKLKLKAIPPEGEAVETEWWPGYYDLTKHEPAYFFRIPNLCNHILKLNEDNSNSDHPLAQCLCNRIWEVFEKTRVHLERLNANYPYAK